MKCFFFKGKTVRNVSLSTRIKWKANHAANRSRADICKSHAQEHKKHACIQLNLFSPSHCMWAHMAMKNLLTALHKD